MKRYFYTDPLAAAWMAKHFGMRFQCPSTGLQIPVIPHVNADHVGKYHIHSDSLHLLEPIPTEETDNGYIRHDLCHVRKGGRDFYGSYHECLGFNGGAEEIRVIQRNGIAFHWPEVERA